MSADRDDVGRKIEDLATGQARLLDAVSALEARIARLSDQIQIVAETATRLKLMAGNAKDRDAAQTRRLEAIEAQIDALR